MRVPQPRQRPGPRRHGSGVFLKPAPAPRPSLQKVCSTLCHSLHVRLACLPVLSRPERPVPLPQPPRENQVLGWVVSGGTGQLQMSSEARGILACSATSERSSEASSRSTQFWAESRDNREGVSVDVRVTDNFTFPLWLSGMFWIFSNTCCFRNRDFFFS